MNTDKLSDMILEIFARFTVSGVVFYLFVIWLPVFVFFRPDYDLLLTDSTVIILCSVVIGLLLDISKLYNLPWKLLRSKDLDKKHLEISIVRACEIKADRQKTSDRNYNKAIKKISTHIHEVFIRIKCPEIYQTIKGARLYPHTLFMALFSIALFVLECVVICVLAHFDKVHTSVDVNGRFLVAVIVPCTFFFFSGINRVRPVGELLTNFQINMIEEGYRHSSPEDKKYLFQRLHEQGLIALDTENVWKVSEE